MQGNINPKKGAICRVCGSKVSQVLTANDMTLQEWPYNVEVSGALGVH